MLAGPLRYWYLAADALSAALAIVLLLYTSDASAQRPESPAARIARETIYQQW
jgi:hypothetical protein